MRAGHSRMVRILGIPRLRSALESVEHIRVHTQTLTHLSLFLSLSLPLSLPPSLPLSLPLSPLQESSGYSDHLIIRPASTDYLLPQLRYMYMYNCSVLPVQGLLKPSSAREILCCTLLTRAKSPKQLSRVCTYFLLALHTWFFHVHVHVLLL